VGECGEAFPVTTIHIDRCAARRAALPVRAGGDGEGSRPRWGAPSGHVSRSGCGRRV